MEWKTVGETPEKKEKEEPTVPPGDLSMVELTAKEGKDNGSGEVT